MSNLNPEEKAREEIDRQLTATGWSVHNLAQIHKVAEASRLSSPESKQLRQDAAATLANEAAVPIATNPVFRELLEKKRRNTEVTIDHLSGDEVIATGYDEEKARGLIQNWQQFLDDNQDGITALQILYNKPHAKRHLVYEEFNEVLVA